MARSLRKWLASAVCLTLLPLPVIAAPEHVFQPGDEIEVQLLSSPDALAGYNLRVVLSEEGVVSLPHVGRVTVGGRTASQIIPDLDKQFRKHFAYAFVGLQLLKAKPLDPEAVYIAGQVRTPGAVTPLQFGKPLTLADIVGRSGGTTDVADLEHVTIYRRQGAVETINLERALADGTATRIVLAAGETVRVPGNWLAGLSTLAPMTQGLTTVVGMVAVIWGIWNASARSTSGVTPSVP
jgi:protein involved in polysaccharide export with SLBB domain